jgi:hypothetical protein
LTVVLGYCFSVPTFRFELLVYFTGTIK